MSRSRKAESLRRARPLLGTLVEIRAEGGLPATLQAAVQAAFEEIEACQRCMSAHGQDSDLARIRKAGRGECLELDWRTAAVLSRAAHWHAVSGGVFDVACAVPLAAHGFLPSEAAMQAAIQAAMQALPWTACLEWLDGHSVRMHAPLHLDLGGIAKGYAVDRACDVLRQCGVEAGCVNAGGDLRVFGRTELIHLRHPANPACLIPLGSLDDGACATSAPYFAQGHRGEEKPGLGQRLTPVYDPRSAHLLPDHSSVSVLGPDAMDCDALTKIVILLGQQALPLLESVQAQAFQLSAAGHCIAIALGAASADTALSPPPRTFPLPADNSFDHHAFG